MDFVCVSVRIPKSGSSSLSRLLADAFVGRRTFFMYDTLNPDTAISALQRMRFRRSRARNLFRRYRTGDVRKAFDLIAREAANGDLIDGGHMDFASVRANVRRPLKMITLMRDPVARSLSEYNYARQSFSNRNIFNRWDTGVMPKVAGRRDFDRFLDFLLEHRAAYGNIASRFMGWDGISDLPALFEANVFHAGILEDSARFAAGLSEKMGKPLSFPFSNQAEIESARDVTKAQRSKIEQIYPRDFALYEWARARV